MHVQVNGVRLFFDVEGAALVPDGPSMHEKPTLLLLHGGPGADHSIYKPRFSSLSDIAQIVYLDHRANGRSEAGPKEAWTLAQWGDDVRAFCEILGIESPIVYGASFGATVALSYATRHPDHPAKLILVSTEASSGRYMQERVDLFEHLGGPAVGDLARRRLLNKEADDDVLDSWLRLAVPEYTRSPTDPKVVKRWVRNPEVTRWFTRAGGEGELYDLFPDLKRISCPTLVLGGKQDPMTPIACQADIAAALPTDLVRFKAFDDCGHGVIPDAPEKAMDIIREFISDSADNAQA